MIRKATIDDVNRLAEIHVFGWRFAYRNLVPDDFLFNTMSVVKRAQSFKQAIEEFKEDTYLFEEDQIIKGFMTMGLCRDSDKNDSFELWGLYVDPLMVRNGIGSELIKYCEKRALELGYKELFLWVLEDNSIGRGFYDKMGYKFDGSRKCLERFGIFEIRYQKQLG